MVLVECDFCGRTFEAGNRSAKLCPECRKVRRRDAERRRRAGRRVKQEKTNSECNEMSAAEISAEARKLGISYGQYVARFGG